MTQRSIREQGCTVVKAACMFINFAKLNMDQQYNQYNHCYICTNPLWSWQQFTQLIHGREQQNFTCWTFFTIDACAPYWASHSDITLLMMSWWGGLGWKTDRIIIVRVRRLTLAATTRQASKRGYAMGTWWRQEKKRTSKEDLMTNIPGFTADASQLEWCSQSASDPSRWKSRCPMLRQEWEDPSPSLWFPSMFCNVVSVHLQYWCDHISIPRITALNRPWYIVSLKY